MPTLPTVPTVPIAPTRTRSRCLSDRLDREWAHLCVRPQVLDRVRSWRLTDRPFASLDEFLTLVGHRTAPSWAADRLLGRLVAVAGDEPLAARIVLQRILPGLLAIVRSEQSRNSHVDAFDVIVGEAWISITRYRVDARPTAIAARLLSDARHRSFTRPRRRRVVEEIATDAHSFAEVILEPQPGAFEELVEVLTEARWHGLDDASMHSVRDFVNHGSARKVAAAQSVTDRAVRYRQRRAVTRIRRLVVAA